MQNAVDGGVSVPSDGQNDGHPSIVLDLVSLIERVQASMRLLDTAIAREATLGGQDLASNIVVLDDVTPRYVSANAALGTCKAGLGMALHFLLDPNASSMARTGSLAAAAGRPG